ncbi:MAG: DsrE family protein [Nitrospirota bacterium]|jgi:hypothetical protein
MKLGILVNTDRHVKEALGIVHAARERGHEVMVFCMDEGTRLLNEPAFTALCALGGVQMSFCGHNAEGRVHASLPGHVVCGSQYDNASMHHHADKVIVL